MDGQKKDTEITFEVSAKAQSRSVKTEQRKDENREACTVKSAKTEQRKDENKEAGTVKVKEQRGKHSQGQ